MKMTKTILWRKWETTA